MGKKQLQDKPDHWSEIVGMPDDWDKKNLTNLINKFKKTTYYFTDKDGIKKGVKGADWIKNEVKDARESHQLTGVGALKNPYGIKSEESGARVQTAIPNALRHEIVEAYPTMFRDIKHSNWFLRKFPEFRVTDKI